MFFGFELEGEDVPKEKSVWEHLQGIPFVPQVEGALDSLDERLERAEVLALKGFNDLASGFSNLFTTQKDSKHIVSVSDRSTMEIVQVGRNPETFLDPMEEEDLVLRNRFQEFKESFNQIDYCGRIASLIDSQPELLDLMKKIVPLKLKEDEFWVRYYFRINELKLKQERRDLLMKSKLDAVADEEIAWSSSDSDHDDGAGDANEATKTPTKKVENAIENEPTNTSDSTIENAPPNTSENEAQNTSRIASEKLEPETLETVNDTATKQDEEPKLANITKTGSVSSGFEIVEEGQEKEWGWD